MTDKTIGEVIWIVVGLAVVLIAAGWGVLQVRSNTNSANNVAAEMEQMNESLLETEFTKYDASEVTGSQVINAIKQYEQEKEDICIIVNNGRSETEYVKTQDLSSEASAKIKDAKKKSDLSHYISPSAIFLGEVIRDVDTDTIIAIKFTKQ